MTDEEKRSVAISDALEVYGQALKRRNVLLQRIYSNPDEKECWCKELIQANKEVAEAIEDCEIAQQS